VDDFLATIENHNVGDQVRLSLVRDLTSDEPQTLDVTVTLAGAASE
jgi:S1-C subfamily serine protease